jgi:signal transduction histidine kinase
MRWIIEREKKFKMDTAHYFFNPITIAKGYLDLVMKDITDEQREKVEAAYHAISRVEKVVKNAIQGGEIRE